MIIIYNVEDDDDNIYVCIFSLFSFLYFISNFSNSCKYSLNFFSNSWATKCSNSFTLYIQTHITSNNIYAPVGSMKNKQQQQQETMILFWKTYTIIFYWRKYLCNKLIAVGGWVASLGFSRFHRSFEIEPPHMFYI